MVKTWSQADRGEEACEECGAVYQVTVMRFPMRDKDHFDYSVCGHRMASWNDTESPSYSLVRRPDEESPAG